MKYATASETTMIAASTIRWVLPENDHLKTFAGRGRVGRTSTSTVEVGVVGSRAPLARDDEEEDDEDVDEKHDHGCDRQVPPDAHEGAFAALVGFPSRIGMLSSSRSTGGEMQITRSTDTSMGPNDWFTGIVYLDPVAVPSGSSQLSATSVHFTPGARTAWHTHPHGQTIYVVEGVGLAQRRGGPIEVIRPGDRVFFEPGEEHWHGASAARFMTHLALLQVDDEGINATWGDHVTDDEYAAAPAIDG